MSERANQTPTKWSYKNSTKVKKQIRLVYSMRLQILRTGVSQAYIKNQFAYCFSCSKI